MTRRVVVLGADAAGLPAANRLASHAGTGAGLEVVLVDRSADHVFAPGYVAVMFGDAEPAAFRRPVADLTHPGVRLVAGEATSLDPRSSLVAGSFGELAYDELVVALGVDARWPEGPPPTGELVPWTLEGARQGREALARLGPGQRVVVGVPGPAYRCPPAQAAEAMLCGARVGFHGGFTIAETAADHVTSTTGEVVEFDVGVLVPPHRPPLLVAASPLAEPDTWPAVTFLDLTHPEHPNVSIIGDLASTALKVGMAGTLAVFQAAHVADRIAATTGGAPARPHPNMSAICFLDPGDTGSFLHCDFTAPAAGTGPAACTIMPWLPYFRLAKQLSGVEWFATMLTGEVG